MKMKTLLGILTLAIYLTSCAPDGSSNARSNYYYDIKATVVQVGQEVADDNTKFHRPTAYHILLIRSASYKTADKVSHNDTTLFYEHRVDVATYHNTNIGDTISIEYSDKDQWFQIKRQ